MAAVAALILLALLGPGAGAAHASAPHTGLDIDIDGNQVLVDEVYLAALHLPPGLAATPDAARTVEQQLLAFLRRAGYTLATVDARAERGRIRATIDEGRLYRIVIRGRDVVGTVTAHLQIELPFDVFNRPQLERLLSGYRAAGARVSYALVPRRVVNHTGPQVDPMALLPGGRHPWPASRYELHIDFTGRGERRQLGLVAGIDPDSIRAGGVLSGGSAILHSDRWQLEAQVGANFFEDLTRRADELHFSRALLDARWLAPTVVTDGLRPTLRIREDLLRRQRQDLRVETYWWNLVEAGAGLSFVPSDGIEVSAELGAQERDLFAIVQLADAEPAARLESSSELRPFVSLAGRIVLEPDRARVDRRHRFEFEARHYPGWSRRPFWFADAQYRRVFEFGWNDLWLRAAAGAVAGHYSVADAIPMTGRYLRGVYGHEFYIDRAGSLAFEYRLSLSRDMFKVGLFHEAAVFRDAERAGGNHDLRAANSFGPSFHALVLDTFQVDFYYAVGFTLDGDFDHGVSLRLEKAF
ncbi:MAG TPA: hypothetical protein VKB80_07600 [Kofleriaceae bacterium]|nr:hypothetical protein [Kofleriaceae bacterium]